MDNSDRVTRRRAGLVADALRTLALFATYSYHVRPDVPDLSAPSEPQTCRLATLSPQTADGLGEQIGKIFALADFANA